MQRAHRVAGSSLTLGLLLAAAESPAAGLRGEEEVKELRREVRRREEKGGLGRTGRGAVERRKKKREKREVKGMSGGGRRGERKRDKGEHG